MRRAAALIGGLAGLGSVAALAAVPSAAPGVAPRPAESSVTVDVGPAAASRIQPVRPSASVRGPGAAASQTVSGTVASTTGVAVTGADASYQGTEPASMTLTHRGSQLTVTVVPR